LTPGTAPRTAIPAPAQMLLEQVALRGKFSPAEIVSGVEDALRIPVLNALAEACTDVSSDRDAVSWRLNPDARRRILDDLSASGRLATAVRDFVPSPHDRFGTFLRNAIAGSSIPAAMLSKAELDDLYTALQFASPYTDKAMQTDLQKELGRRDADESFRFVRPRKLVGREQELARLEHFATSERPVGEETVLVTGIGGAGKSALLSELVVRVRKPDWSGIPVIWFDFDRALLETPDPVTMLMELTRQLALHRPDLAQAFSSFRKACRRRWNPASEHGHSFQRRAVYESELWSLWNDMLGPLLPMGSPVLLVLDTFEEVLFRDPYQLRTLRTWVENLRTEGGINGLRTIISGRIGADIELPGQPIAQRLAVSDLSREDAESLLATCIETEGKNPSEYPIASLAEVVGGNPLLIKLLARFCASLSASEAIALFVDGEGGLPEEVVQGFLYTRILKRIRSSDPDVAKLAHPGLALRRVTPDIIRRVLAGPCQLGEIDELRARTLFDHLTAQVWLVERVGPNEVVHRAELRRHMLPLISAEDPEAFEAVHRAAAEYYGSNSDPRLHRTLQRLEYRYHAAFLTDGGTPDDPAILADIVGQDIDVLPVAVRARLKSSQNKVLTPSEQATLDSTASVRVATKRASGTIASGEDLFGSGEPELAGSDLDRVAKSVQLVARFERGEFSKVIDLFLGSPAEFVDELAGSSARTLPPVHETGLWKVALACLCHPESSARVLSAMAAQFGRMGKREAARLSGVLDTIGALLGGPPSRPRRSEFEHSNDVYHLRQLQLAGYGFPPGVSVPIAMVCYLAPEVIRWMRSKAPALLPFSPGNGDIHDSLAMLRRPLVSGETISLDNMPAAAARVVRRGMTPELHAPLRVQLMDCARAEVCEFADGLGERFKWWPTELMSPAFLPAFERDTARWSATLVEMADLAGVLGDLVGFVANASSKPSAASVQALWTSYDRKLGEWRP
jgi:hypothetical protein